MQLLIGHGQVPTIMPEASLFTIIFTIIYFGIYTWLFDKIGNFVIVFVLIPIADIGYSIYKITSHKNDL